MTGILEQSNVKMETGKGTEPNHTYKLNIELEKWQQGSSEVRIFYRHRNIADGDTCNGPYQVSSSVICHLWNGDIHRQNYREN